jgi:chaperone BCS1
MTSRHIINLSLHQYTTKRQLHNLFFEERIQIEKPGGMNEFLILPIDKRIYIIEDIDCMTDIVLDRKEKVEYLQPHSLEDYSNNNGLQSVSLDDDDSYTTLQPNEKVVEPKINSAGYEDEKRKRMEENLDDKLTLSFLLNLLDGVLETPGRIIIMTTNYPEKLDKALVRPGRVDMNICFKKCTHTTILDMLVHFYEVDKDSLKDYSFADGIFTPAEVYQIMFNHIQTMEEACNKLCINVI